MIFLYEIMIWIKYYGLDFQIRNGVDVLFRRFIFDQNYIYLSSSLLMVIFLALFYIHYPIIKMQEIKISYLLFMLFESIIWSLVLFLLMMLFQQSILSLNSIHNIDEQFFLSIGAGIWEELFFRVIVLGLVGFILYTFFNCSRYFSYFIALLVSSIIFSSFHYIGNLGEVFTFETFYARIFAGIILGIIYMLRGFGITAYTHIFYDMTVTSITVLK